ncbi:hypothetical protein ACWD0J_15845 [Streptomyces sp. NPDC003011]
MSGGAAATRRRRSVALRRPLTAVLPAFRGRQKAGRTAHARVEVLGVLGEREPPEFWLERATFG